MSNISKSSLKKIVITGGAGFIGSALSNSLTPNNTVTLIDDGTAADWNRCRGNFSKVQIDLSECSMPELESIFKGVDIVFHLAAVKLHNALNSFEEIQRKNVIATKKVFEAAGLAGVKKIVFTSSLYAYGSMGPNAMKEDDVPQPDTFYGISKLTGEHLMRMYANRFGFEYAIARLFFIYGPQQYADGGYKSVIIKNIEKSLSRLPLTVKGDGQQELDYVYIDDCVNILNLIANRRVNGVVNVSTGISVSINNVVSEICKHGAIKEIEMQNADWTNGSRRVGNNEKLLSIIGEYNFKTLSEGILETWNSMSEISND
jgi:UDP-glucose 4-epimerase